MSWSRSHEPLVYVPTARLPSHSFKSIWTTTHNNFLQIQFHDENPSSRPDPNWFVAEYVSASVSAALGFVLKGSAPCIYPISIPLRYYIYHDPNSRESVGNERSWSLNPRYLYCLGDLREMWQDLLYQLTFISLTVNVTTSLFPFVRKPHILLKENMPLRTDSSMTQHKSEIVMLHGSNPSAESRLMFFLRKAWPRIERSGMTCNQTNSRPAQLTSAFTVCSKYSIWSRRRMCLRVVRRVLPILACLMCAVHSIFPPTDGKGPIARQATSFISRYSVVQILDMALPRSNQERQKSLFIYRTVHG